MSDPDQFDRGVADGIVQPCIDEIQAKHTQEHVEQGANNLRWLAAAPDGRESEDADKVIDAALKALDLLRRVCGLLFQVT